MKSLINVIQFWVLYKEIINIRPLILLLCCTDYVWSPYRQINIETIEKVQMRAIKMVQQLKNILMRLSLPTLNIEYLDGT